MSDFTDLKQIAWERMWGLRCEWCMRTISKHRKLVRHAEGVWLCWLCRTKAFMGRLAS